MQPSRFRRLPARDLGGELVLFEAVTVGSRLLGLAFIRDLPASQALLLPRCRSVHTFGMRFATDVLFLDAHRRPVRLVEALGAGRVRLCREARSVLETRAGEGERFARAIRAIDMSSARPLSRRRRRAGAA